MKKLFRKEFLIGISVIVALVILVFGIDYLKGINLFRPANFYIANYDNVAGLELSAPVTIDGYKVGQVREINFNYEKPGKIEVVLALNKNLHLPEDSKASIESSLLGGAFVNITLGHSAKLIPVGGNVQTSVTPDLMASLQQEMMPKVNQILPRIDSLLYNLNQLVADPAISQSIGRLDGITDNLLLASGGLNTTLNRDVPGVIRNVNGITTRVDTIAYNLSVLSNQLKQLPLQPTMENVELITRNLSAFSDQLNSKESTLGKLTTDPELYNRLNRVSADIDSLIVDIKKNPKRYINIKLL